MVILYAVSMLSKKNRLTRRECDELLREKQRIFHTPSLFVRAVTAREFKAAVAVSKKIVKRSVARNTVRRTIYNSLRSCLDIPVHLLISIKKGTEVSKEKIREELKTLENDLRQAFLDTTL